MNQSAKPIRSLPKFFFHLALLIALASFLTACGAPKKSITSDQAKVDYDLLFSMPEQIISYEDQVAPIFGAALLGLSWLLRRPLPAQTCFTGGYPAGCQ